ncbi:MAG: SH3 domain-containing protein [Chloroflexota bacterium]|nr:SH3 domain-containing protein [Chloroflexota bacterium]
MRSSKLIFLAAMALLIITPGCALVNAFVDYPTPTPVVQRALRPTFTPTPLPENLAELQAPPEPPPLEVAEVAAAPQGAAAEQAAQPHPSPTATFPVIGAIEPAPAPSEPNPSEEQPAAAEAPEPIATPTPFIEVEAESVAVWFGPGTAYEKMGDLPTGTQLAIVGRSEAWDWWQVCCHNDQTVWVQRDQVTGRGGLEAIAMATGIPEPPTATPVPTATRQPVPQVVVQSARVNVRSGPGTSFEKIGQISQGNRLDITGRNPDSQWFQICCVDGQQGWVTADLVRVEGPVEKVAVNLPTATPAPSPTAVAVAAAGTPLPPPTPDASALELSLSQSETFPFNDRDYLRVGVKVSDDENNPLGDYYLRVQNETTGQIWVSRPSGGLAWQYSAPSDDFDDFREINIDFNTIGKSPLIGHSFIIWLVDGSGSQVTSQVTFGHEGDDTQWLYLAFSAQ